MTLSASELSLLAGELAARLPGAHVQKVFVPTPRLALVELRVPGQSLLLQLTAEPGAARAGVVPRRPPSPEKALAVQGLWRAHLTGARLDHVASEDRTLVLRFSTDAGPRSILQELDRLGGELLLLDSAGHLLGATPGDRARERGLVRGTTYTPPSGADPAPDRNRLTRVAAEDPDPFAVSRAIEALYGPAAAGRRAAEAKAAVLGPLRSARRKLVRTIARVEEDRARIAEAERYRVFGDLLKPVMTSLKRGDVRARVTEYGAAGPRETEVPLLPHLSPRENMERYYHLHRRLSRSAGRVDERLQLLQTQLASLDRLAATADRESDPERLGALLDQARSSGLLRDAPAEPGRSRAPTRRQPFREFTSAAGARIWVGRNARDNDELTFRHARGNDLWLHARGQTGSHVVVPGTGESGPDGETLLDAAELAAHFSAARGESLVEVASTRCKYVRKPRGGAPGAVTFSQERTIALRHEPARLARLLASEQRSG
jgi:predicted ribosome quality control (RQC) complex YloA/Tae2 family protein